MTKSYRGLLLLNFWARGHFTQRAISSLHALFAPKNREHSPRHRLAQEKAADFRASPAADNPSSQRGDHPASRTPAANPPSKVISTRALSIQCKPNPCCTTVRRCHTTLVLLHQLEQSMLMLRQSKACSCQTLSSNQTVPARGQKH